MRIRFLYACPMSNCLVLIIHHWDMVTSPLPSHSASHLFVLCCSARTTFIRLTFTIHNGFCAPKVNRFPENSEQGQIDVAFFSETNANG